MSLDAFDSYECDGQMSLEDMFYPSQIIAVSDVFARARKQMNVAELKTFTYALTQIKWTESNNKNIVYLDKKKLANIIGITSDYDHLSADLKRSIGKLRQHSEIEISLEDKDFWESGQFITNVRMVRDNVRLTFYEEYMPLFQGLEKDYITMWSEDIFQMRTERSIIFYEELRSKTSGFQDVYEYGYGIKALKELFGIPKDGKGSYMRKDGHFDRQAFERYVIDPLCQDLANCKMIQLSKQANGKYYEKVKSGNKVLGYRFYWTYSKYPRVASATEVNHIQERVDKDPLLLKMAKDVVKGASVEAKTRKAKKNSFNNFEARKASTPEREARYQELLEKSLLRVELTKAEEAEFKQLSEERSK